MPLPGAILTVNTGSSSVRLELFETGVEPAPRSLAHSHIDGGKDDPAGVLREFLHSGPSCEITVVAHRLVHGGAKLMAPAIVDGGIERQIEDAVPLAPLHNATSLAYLRAARSILPGEVPQVVVPDTAFFADLPAVARDYALPLDLRRSHGIRRYGFHGIAHHAMLSRWQAGRPPEFRDSDRVISLQLGSGCSVAAMRGGRPIDTSMGFSPLEGLVMATRPGDLDPGVVLHLLRSGVGLVALETILNQQSGLLGLSGISGDMRTLLTSSAPAAGAAVDAFCYRARKYVGAYLAALGGAEAILIGGGIGENLPDIRERILSGLEFAGLRLDQAANRNPPMGGKVHSPDSEVAVVVVTVDEARVLAAEAARLLA